MRARPFYWIQILFRECLYSNPAGVMVYHNTIVAEDSTNQQVSNAHFANNHHSRLRHTRQKTADI